MDKDKRKTENKKMSGERAAERNLDHSVRARKLREDFSMQEERNSW